MTETAEPKKTSLTHQSVWILVAKIAGFALNTLLPLLIVRYLTQENVGLYRQAFLVAANAVLVLPLGFSMSAYYFLNREPEKQAATVFNILLFNFAMGAGAFLLLFFAPGILGAAFQNPELERMAPALGLLIWVWIFAGFLETAALAMQEARLAAGFIVGSQLVKTLLMIGAVLAFRSVDSLVYATIVLFALQGALLLCYLNRRFPRFWGSFDWPFFRRQMAYALPFGVSIVLYVGQTDLHNYFVSHSFSAAEFAIYSVGCFQLPLISMLYESVGAVMIPRLSQMQAEGRKNEMLQLTLNATHRLAFFYFPMFAFLMIMAGEFITTLFTGEYAASVQIFRVNLLVLPLFSFAADPVTRAYPSAGKFLLKVRVFICIGLFATFWLGMGRFGLLDMISIVVGAMLLEKTAAVWISARMLDMRRSDVHMLTPVAKVAMAAAAAACILWLIHAAFGNGLLTISILGAGRILALAGMEKGALFIGGGIFLGLSFGLYSLCYLAGAAVFGAFSPEDREKLEGILRKVFVRSGVSMKAA